MEPLLRRIIRSSRLPSSLLISRSCTRAAIVPSRPMTGREWSFDGGDQDPLSEPANVAGQTTRCPKWGQIRCPKPAEPTVPRVSDRAPTTVAAWSRSSDQPRLGSGKGPGPSVSAHPSAIRDSLASRHPGTRMSTVDGPVTADAGTSLIERLGKRRVIASSVAAVALIGVGLAINSWLSGVSPEEAREMISRKYGYDVGECSVNEGLTETLATYSGGGTWWVCEGGGHGIITPDGRVIIGGGG